MWKFLVLLTTCVALSAANSPTSHLNAADKARLKVVFKQALDPKGDISGIYYAILGYQELGESVADSKAALCAAAAKYADDNSLETIHAAAGAGAALGCPIKLGAKASEVIKTSLGESSSTASVFYAAKAQTNVGGKLDSASLAKTLADAIKKDDSLLSLGLAFHVASLLDGGANQLNQFFDRIEDVMVQADEVDGRLLQFEGGLSVTSVVLTGATALAQKVKKPLAVDEAQMLKFANYLISRKSVQQPKGAYHLLNGIRMMSTSSQFIPLSISLLSSVSVSSEQPKVTFSVTDLMGNAPATDLKLVLDSAVRSTDGVSVATKKELTKSKDSQFSVDLMALKPASGFYELQLTATPVKQGEKYIGNTGVLVTVKVLTSVTVQEPELKITDSEQSTAGKNYPLKFPSKLGQKVAVDYRERIQLSFAVQDSTKANILVHQAFVRLSHVKTGSEIVYVAEAEDGNVYKFDLDLTSKGAEFLSKSGDYSFTLIVGDAVVSNPIAWHLADISINFPESDAKKEPGLYDKKPEITHIFRSPEARPSKLVSDAFTLLCLSPLLLLVILWIRLGVNISNFPFSLTGLGFHVGLGSIFMLYLYFWLQLNMFETVKYLVILGVVTFLCGNSLLSNIAKKNK